MSIRTLYFGITMAAVTVITCIACSTGNNTDLLVEEAMCQAGDNAGELQAVIDHYSGNEKTIARYMVASTVWRYGRWGAGMDSIEALYREGPNKPPAWFDDNQLARGRRYAAMPISEANDASTLTADYFIENIDKAMAVKRRRRWNNDLTAEQFCELLLPYRSNDEKPTRWRGMYEDWLAPLEDSIAGLDNSVDAARIVSAFIKTVPYNDQLSTPARSALDLLEAPYGYCREDCDRTLYAMRAMGIPVCVDMIATSPETGTAHSWNVVWDNIDRRMRMFDNGRYPPTRDSLHYDQRRKGKIFRYMSLPDMERMKRRIKNGSIAPHLSNPWLKDVTAEYFGHNKAEVGVWDKISASDDVYLGVFTPRGLIPIDLAERHGDKAVFTDIEPQLVFFPIVCDSECYSPCGYPFLVTNEGLIHSFIPDTTDMETVVLTRKMPLRFHQKEWFGRYNGFTIQSAPDKGGPWTDLHRITELPTSNYHRILLPKPMPAPYLRIIAPPKPYLAGIEAFADTAMTQRLDLSIVGDSATRVRQNAVVDNDILTWYACIDGEQGVMLKTSPTAKVAAFYVNPRNDDNFVVPAQEYELLYFAGPDGWKSAGRRMSTGFSIDFEAPKGAVLWLRNLTKGREEQIFIWRDGRQLFNIDLHDIEFGNMK